MNSTKKKVSVVVPVYNEVGMLDEIAERVHTVFANLKDYDYELVFFDDGSSDGTCQKIEKLAEDHPEIKGVFYARNFGYLKNTFYAVQQAKGDCAFLLHADLQNPPELIPEFLKKWEDGAQVVLGVKNKSKENKFMFFLRSVFYFIMIHIFGIRIVPHATEFELFDKSFIDILKNIKTNTPFLRGIISEYASCTETVYYTQNKRKKGRSKFNFNTYYDFALCGIVQYSSCIPRRIIFSSLIGLLISFAEFLLVFLPSLPLFTPPEIINRLLLRIILYGIIILIIISSVIWEYIIFIANNSGEKIMIIENKRINY